MILPDPSIYGNPYQFSGVLQSEKLDGSHLIEFLTRYEIKEFGSGLETMIGLASDPMVVTKLTKFGQSLNLLYFSRLLGFGRFFRLTIKKRLADEEESLHILFNMKQFLVTDGR